MSIPGQPRGQCTCGMVACSMPVKVTTHLQTDLSTGPIACIKSQAWMSDISHSIYKKQTKNNLIQKQTLQSCLMVTMATRGRSCE